MVSDLLSRLPADLLARIIDEAFIVSITDEKGIIRYVNDTFCKVSRFNREELLGQPHRIVKSHIHSREFFKDMWDTIQRGETWHGEVCNKRKDGELYWVDSFIMPIPGANGPSGYLSIRYDVTQLKEHESTVQNQGSLLEMKTRRLNTLAFWIAHDIRPPIANLLGLADLMTQKGAPDQESLLKHVAEQAQRADEILRKIMATAIASDVIPESTEEGATDWLSGK